MLHKLTIARTLTIVMWLLLPVIAARVQADPDVWWQLRSASQNIEAGRIVQEEVFSYTCSDGQCPTRLQHEWLGQPVLLAFWNVLGEAGLSLYAIVFAMLGMAVIYSALYGGPYLKAFILILGAFSASIFWAARPLMLSFVLAAITLWIVYRYHRHGQTRWLWALPPMFALWGNLHGGWPQGALILVAAAAGMAVNLLVYRRTLPHPMPDDKGTPDATPARIRPLLYFLIPCVLAAVLLPLINPYGAEMLAVPFDTVGFDFQPIFIMEWQPPRLSAIEMSPFFFILALTVLVMALDWRRADFVEIIMVSGTAYMALTSARHIAFFTTVALIPLSLHAANIGADRGWSLRPSSWVTPAKARINVALIVIIGLSSLLYLVMFLSPANIDKAMRQKFPVAALEYMRESPPPHQLLNSWNFGGYLIYFAPDYPVFIDGRADLYRAFTWTYIDLAQGKDGWRDEFAKWDIHSVLLEPGVPLVNVLRDEPDWSVAFEDESAVLLVRD